MRRPGYQRRYCTGDSCLICRGHRRVIGAKYQSFLERKEIHISKAVYVETDKTVKSLFALKVRESEVLAFSSSGGCRISQRRGRQRQTVSAKLSQKLHEYKENWDEGGARPCDHS